MGRLVAWAVAGVEPKHMGIGPVPAARKALDRAKMKLEQMDLVEVNEAFAPQYLAVERELGLDRSRTNVCGGAIAIGHPLAATGTRITIHLLHSLRREKQRFGLGSACIGGGQGARSEEHTSELQSPCNLVCRLLPEKKKNMSS